MAYHFINVFGYLTYVSHYRQIAQSSSHDRELHSSLDINGGRKDTNFIIRIQKKLSYLMMLYSTKIFFYLQK